jgi:hypothetical protein
VITRDPEIRHVLHVRLGEQHGGDPHTAVVDEFCVCRSRARVDVAVINGHLAGFEIKSDADRLDRLPMQMRYYDRVFDEVTVVAAARHLTALTRRLPDWYGILATESDSDGLTLRTHQKLGRNPDPCTSSRAQLLWREDMVELLLAAGAGAEVRRQPRRVLLPQVVEAIPEHELLSEIRRRVRLRLRVNASSGSTAA